MISFVILNYKSTNDTIECVKLIKKYTSDLILLKDNVGFAKGNNEGCVYAIDKYHPDFLCVINSDIIINQKDFITSIEKLYKKYGKKRP